MPGELDPPYLHAQVYTSGFPITLNPPARGGIIISNFLSGTSSISFTTVGGETIVMTAAANAQANGPVYLPIQVASINSLTNIGAVTALWN
jgi:hypothetical protein